MDRPDVNKPDEIARAICGIEVLGDFSRSLSPSPDGGWEPDRCVGKLSDFFTEFQIGRMTKALFEGSHVVYGFEGVLVGGSADEVVFDTPDGEVRFRRVREPERKAT